jgi:hypothetical protein
VPWRPGPPSGPARSQAKIGATVPAGGISDGRAFLVEGFITFLLVFVVIAVTCDRRASVATAARSIGLALVSAVLIGGPSTGGAVNPVRALGPEIVSGTFTSFWVYLFAPVVGGVAAAFVYDRVTAEPSHRPRGPDGADGRRRPMGRRLPFCPRSRRGSYLKMSFTFSPACLRLPLAWSP